MPGDEQEYTICNSLLFEFISPPKDSYHYEDMSPHSGVMCYWLLSKVARVTECFLIPKTCFSPMHTGSVILELCG